MKMSNIIEVLKSISERHEALDVEVFCMNESGAFFLVAGIIISEVPNIGKVICFVDKGVIHDVEAVRKSSSSTPH